MITTTFAKLHDADACAKRYKHLAKSLGGVRSYGRKAPISLLQILEANGLDDALWALCACEIDADGERLLRLWACWCAESALTREREAGREPDAKSWAAVEVARRYANGQATDEELSAARAAAWAAALAAWEAAWAAARAAAWAAARAADRTLQAAELRRMLTEGGR